MHIESCFTFRTPGEYKPIFKMDKIGLYLTLSFKGTHLGYTR